MSLQDDLARWEAGYLSREALIASYASNDRNLSPRRTLSATSRRTWTRTLMRTCSPTVASELALVKILDLHERLGRDRE